MLRDFFPDEILIFTVLPDVHTPVIGSHHHGGKPLFAETADKPVIIFPVDFGFAVCGNSVVRVNLVPDPAGNKIPLMHDDRIEAMFDQHVGISGKQPHESFHIAVPQIGLKVPFPDADD